MNGSQGSVNDAKRPLSPLRVALARACAR
jgi:hypothetical protein